MLSALNYLSFARELTALLENVCGVSDMNFTENSSNWSWDTAQKIQLSSRKVPLVIKSTEP